MLQAQLENGGAEFWEKKNYSLTVTVSSEPWWPRPGSTLDSLAFNTHRGVLNPSKCRVQVKCACRFVRAHAQICACAGKIYLPPLTNASVTCESPSSHCRPLVINHRTKSTSILFLCYPQTKSALTKSILVRFGLGK